MTQASNARKKRKAKVVHIKPKAKIHLNKNDLRWYENLVLKEQLIRKQTQEALLEVGKGAEEMMVELSAREGVDLRGYDIDWQTGECKLPSTKTAAKPEPAPTPDESPEE